MKSINSFFKKNFNAKRLKLYLPILVIVLVIAITFATCSQPAVDNDSDLPEESTPVETAEETPPEITPPEETEPEETEEPPYEGPYNPLSGEPCETDISANRPYAIMINNMKIAQPQLGISKAEIIYEVPVEGGITRMMAIFQDMENIGVIGSIRSARPYFVDIAHSYDSVYIHAGGSPQAYDTLASRNTTRLDGVNGGKTDIFYRDSARRQKMGYEHSMVTSGDLIAEYLPTYDFRLTHNDGFGDLFNFTDDEVPDNWFSAISFDVVYSGSKKTTFTYNTRDGVYGLGQHGTYYTDGNSGKQITATNVLILKVPVSQIANDAEGRLNISLTGSGSGYYARDGKYTEIEWSRANESSKFTYTLKDGTELLFGRGKTYICILPRDLTVSFN